MRGKGDWLLSCHVYTKAQAKMLSFLFNIENSDGDWQKQPRLLAKKRSENPGGLTLSKGEMVWGMLESAARLPGEGCSTHSCTIHSNDCMKGT